MSCDKSKYDNTDEDRFLNTLTHMDNNGYTNLKQQWEVIKEKLFNDSKKDEWKEWSKLFKKYNYEPKDVDEKKLELPESNLLELINFRKSITDYIRKYFCENLEVNPYGVIEAEENGICHIFGSNKYSSDVDISIKTKVSNIYVNISTLNTIIKFLDELFDKSSTQFNYNKYLDINFYLTDYQTVKPSKKFYIGNIIENRPQTEVDKSKESAELERGIESIKHNLAEFPSSSKSTLAPAHSVSYRDERDKENKEIRSYFIDLNRICISNYFNVVTPTKRKDDSSLYPSQFQYAFFEYLYYNKPRPKILSFEYDLLIKKIYILKNQLNGRFEESLDVDPKSEIQTIINNIISIFSQVSTAEDETYHTQGSFIHVVTLIQRNVKIEPISYIPKIREIYKNLLLCSVIENSCFSFTHFAIDNPDKVKKYILRVLDGFIRIYGEILNYSLINLKLKEEFKNLKIDENRLYKQALLNEVSSVKSTDIDEDYRNLYVICKNIFIKIADKIQLTEDDRCGLQTELDNLYSKLILSKLSPTGGANSKTKKNVMTKTDSKVLLNNGKNYIIYTNNRGTKYIKTKGNYELLSKCKSNKK